MKKLMFALLATAAFAALGTQAYAFSGTVVFGPVNAAKNNLVVTNKAGSTSLAFNANWMVDAGGSGAYTAATGLVTYTNFSYTTGGGPTTPATPFTLWSFTSGTHTYTFELDSNIAEGANTASVFQVSGTGTAFIDGGDPSAGTWTLTGSPGSGSFKFVAASVTSVVPDGGSAVALLGIALAGIEAARRKIGARKA